MVFKVNRLDRNNKIEHVYVYGADESIFSDSERKQHAEDKSEIHYLKDQQIHLDDSIRVIKNKILKAVIFSPNWPLLEKKNVQNKNL